MNSVKRQLFLIFGIILIFFGLFNCTQPPKPPVIEPKEIVLLENEKITIKAYADNALDYEWKLNGTGQISTTSGDTIVYTAPNKGGDTAILQVIAKNNGGPSPFVSVVIKIPEKKIKKLNALAIPAGWMCGGTKPARYISYGNSPDGGRDKNSCIEIIYKPGSGWGGIIWWPLSCGSSGTPDSWNKVKNDLCYINLLNEGNFTKINKLTFWAKGKKGNEKIEFKVGASDISPRPGESTGQISLISTWEQYSLDLTNLDLANTTALFMWVAADDANIGGANFYLDDIQFEGI